MLILLISIPVIIFVIWLYKIDGVPFTVKNVIIGIVAIFGFVYFIFPFLGLLFVGIIRTPAPPVPEITYGEFPFRLEYEIDGERFVIEDTLIAEFDRSIAGNATMRARRIWNTRLESGEERRVRIKEATNLTITFSPGLAEYHMGDLHGGDLIVQNPSIVSQPHVFVRTVIDGRSNVDYFLLEEAHEILEEHGIKLISWYRTAPIINSFH